MNTRTSSLIPPRWIVIAYLAVAFATTTAHDWFVDARLVDARRTLHEQVMADAAPAPIQYRIMTYYAAEGLMKLGVPFRESYLVLRFAFTFLAALAFHAFLAVWFVPLASFAGTLFFLAVLPLTYIRYYMQPMDLPNLCFFLAGCLLILKRKDWLLVPLTAVAMTNRETAILIVLPYVFVRYDELPLKDLALRAGAVFGAGMGVYALLRAVFQVKHLYSDVYYLDFNLAEPRTYLYAAAVFGPFLYLALRRRGEQPKFLRRAVLFIPFFVVIHYTIAIMVEPRLWMPVIPLLVAAGLWTVVPGEMKYPRQEGAGAVKNFVTRRPAAAYGALVASFLVFFAGFFSYYRRLHLDDRDTLKRVEAYIAESKRFAQGGWNEAAVQELSKALVYAPDSDAVHYELALLYAYRIGDQERALEHYEKCLKSNPYHLDRASVQREIERLNYALSVHAAQRAERAR